MTLHDHHRRLLEVESAIAADVIAERGAFTATQRQQLRELRFSERQARVPALVLPVHGVAGDVPLHQARPDEPRRDSKGRIVKYETPTKARLAIDVPPRVLPVLGDPSKPLALTEGIRKTDAAVSAGLNAIGLLGVWSWRGKNEHGGSTALPDWHDIALNGRRVLLCFDSDAMAKHEVHDALETLIAWLRLRHAEPWVIYLPTLNGGDKCGLDDYLAAGHSADELLALARPELLPLPGEPSTAESKPKPKLDRVGPLDELLDRAEHWIRRYIAIGRHESATLAVWIAHTHTFRASPATPYGRVVSPEHDAGKTTLLEVMGRIVANPWLVASVSTAALVRRVDRARPTLLLDEVDNLLGREREFRSALLGIVNSGYKASGAHTMCVGEGANMEERDFASYCPKMLSGLGQLPRALASRSITFHMERATPEEEAALEEWYETDPHPDAERLHAELAAWAETAFDDLRAARPARLDGLHTRSWEVWRALIAIADLAGGAWPERVRAAAHALVTVSRRELPTSYAHSLLADVREIFEQRVVDRLRSADLLDALHALEDQPWSEYGRASKPITARQVGDLLRPYRIRSKSVWFGKDDTAKGFERRQFEDAWRHYLLQPKKDAEDVENDDDTADPPISAGSIRHAVRSQAQSGIEPDSYPSGYPPLDGNEIDRKARPDAEPDGMTDRNPPNGGGDGVVSLFETSDPSPDDDEIRPRTDRLERTLDDDESGLARLLDDAMESE